MQRSPTGWSLAPPAPKPCRDRPRAARIRWIMTDAERLIEIETRLLFQDQELGRLREALREQEKRVDRLQEFCDRLRAKAAAGPEDDLSDEPPPPHYGAKDKG